jgi:hypothetical protein
MAYNDRIVYNGQAVTTTTLNGVTAGSIQAGPTLLMSRVSKGTLSALVALDAETNTITLEASWFVSNDNTTYVKVPPLNNATVVVWATGTAGADATVTKVLSAPDACYGYRYARIGVTVGVTNALAADTYAIGYNYLLDELA